MESANFDPMGFYDSCSGIFESKMCGSNLHFIGGLVYLSNHLSNLKSDDRQIGSNNNMDDRNQCLHLPLRFTLTH